MRIPPPEKVDVTGDVAGFITDEAAPLVATIADFFPSVAVGTLPSEPVVDTNESKN